MPQPAAKLRDGRLTATIWANEKSQPDPESGEIGTFYSVDIARSYKDQADTWQESSSFTGAELLRVSRLAALAYDEIQRLRNA